MVKAWKIIPSKVQSHTTNIKKKSTRNVNIYLNIYLNITIFKYVIIYEIVQIDLAKAKV